MNKLIKKAFALLLVLTLGLVLVSCKKDPAPTPTPDPNPPVDGGNDNGGNNNENNEENNEDEEEGVIKVVLEASYEGNLAGVKVTLDVTDLTKLVISGKSLTFAQNGAPSRGNIFIKDIKVDESETFIDLEIGSQNTAWNDGKTHLIDILKFKDYQIREKYDGIGVRANHETFEGDNGYIEIDVTEVNSIEFVIFSTIPNLSAEGLNITIQTE